MNNEYIDNETHSSPNIHIIFDHNTLFDAFCVLEQSS